MRAKLAPHLFASAAAASSRSDLRKGEMRGGRWKLAGGRTPARARDTRRSFSGSRVADREFRSRTRAESRPRRATSCAGNGELAFLDAAAAKHNIS